MAEDSIFDRAALSSERAPHAFLRRSTHEQPTAALKHEPEDFIVEEVPSYEPSGQGEHLFVWLEKRDETTRRAMESLASHAGIDVRDVGSAGLKDRRAVTRQWLSFPGLAPDAFIDFESPSVRVLKTARHEHKLKTGHLRGNRFSILLRGLNTDEQAQIAELLPSYQAGFPNYFGAQRFGRDGGNVEQARRWLVGGGRAPRGRFKRRLMISAYQAAAFNAVLARRVAKQTEHMALAGDVLKTARGGVFQEEDLKTAKARVESGEVRPTGPLFGKKMRRATDIAGDLEHLVEGEYGFDANVYSTMGKLGQGTRRALTANLDSLSSQPSEEGLRLFFTLAAGCYATVFLRELVRFAPLIGEQSI